MTLLSTWNGNDVSRSGNFYNDCWGYVDGVGNEYAIIGSPQKIHFLNISTPTQPVLVNEFRGGSTSLWRDIKTYSCYAYSVADEGAEGLMIFDLSGLPNETIRKVYQKNDDFSRAHNIYIDVPMGRLYIIGSNTRNQGLIVYDLTENPAAPKLLASVDLPGQYIHDAFVKNNIAYCSHGFNGLYIYDFTNPANPQYKASLNTGGYNHSNWLTEDEQYLIYAEEVPTGLPLRLVDLSGVEDDNLQIVSTFSNSLLTTAQGTVTYHNPFVVDQYAIISSYEDGVTIFDLQSPTDPQRVAFYDTYVNSQYSGYNGCWGVYPFLPSGNIIASDGLNGLFILSTSLTLTTDCNNGIKDDFEEGVDRGGFCPSYCTNNSNKCSDYDKDGYSVELDCDDFNPLVPTTPGTICNDGDPTTQNDRIQSDGCSCQGQ